MTGILSIVLVVVSSILSALGQLGLKFGSMKLDKTVKGILGNYALLSGVFFYGLSSVVFVLALTGGELTVLYPIASLNYVWANLLAIKYLNEKMNMLKWSGIAAILIGVALIV